MPDFEPSGLEPRIGGKQWRPHLTGYEPSLGGERRFDSNIWGRLIDLRWPSKEALIAGLTPALCELYAGVLIQVMPEGSAFNKHLEGGVVWSGHYTPEQRAAAAQSLGLIGARHGSELAASLVEPLVGRLVPYESDQVRVEAARALGLLGDERAEKPLIKAMTGGSWRLRMAAIQSLGQVGNLEALAFLLDLQDHGESLNESMAAMEALGALGGRLGGQHQSRIFDTLMRVFVRGDGLQRCAAARALGALGNLQALDPLLQAAIHARRELQCAAVHALGMLGDPQAVPPLISILTSSNYPLRQDTADALVRIGKVAVDPALAVLQHPDPGIRRSVIEVLGKLGARDAAGALIEQVDDRHVEIRQAAVNALGMIGDPVAVEALIGALEDHEPLVRKEAAMMLSGFGDERAVGPLCLALWDADMTVRWFAAYTLGTIGDPRAVQPLCQVLGDRSENVVNAAADALFRLGDVCVVSLVEHARTADREVRQVALAVLERIGTPLSLAALDELRDG
ncbi:MAG: HEAT repeat domain-containing protein [Anaerolineae bacterium]|nr:HEAT repeat domain-containing protein [Anaerolineae bacterium]